MDNHGVALWCWFQHLSNGEKYNLIHIDQHYDTLYSRIDAWMAALPQHFRQINLQDYLSLQDKLEDIDEEVSLIRHDNYLSLFLQRYSGLVDKCIFATHDDGDIPRWENKSMVELSAVPGNFDLWLENGRWIVNMDMDYFFYDNPSQESRLMFSDQYINDLFRAIERKQADGTIAVLTIALSPEYSGGWKSAEELCAKICELLDLPFSLPE